MFGLLNLKPAGKCKCGSSISNPKRVHCTDLYCTDFFSNLDKSPEQITVGRSSPLWPRR
jgi:hypothetical protein